MRESIVKEKLGGGGRNDGETDPDPQLVFADQTSSGSEGGEERGERGGERNIFTCGGGGRGE